eukprot:COSAG01_NODE_920_length_12728_cov_38.396864_8_plen_48_part_00
MDQGKGTESALDQGHLLLEAIRCFSLAGLAGHICRILQCCCWLWLWV